MDKKLILAVAGSGKTYYIANHLGNECKNVVITFTNQNKKNIIDEISKVHVGIPSKTVVTTFDSFLYQNFILPVEPFIMEKFGKKYVSKGIINQESPKCKYFNKRAKKYDKLYKKGDIRRYITPTGYYYLEEIVTLVKEMLSKKRSSYYQNTFARLKKCFDYIYIDEFQDFRKEKYNVIEIIIKEFDKIIAVGDYYQHSLAGKDRAGKPFENSTYKSYVAEMRKLFDEVDTEVLVSSRRCPKTITDFITSKLGINIESFSGAEDTVIKYLGNDEIQDVIQNDAIKKLVHSNNKNYLFPCVNWSYSKGDTYDDICIILTKKFNNVLDHDFNLETASISIQSINAFYVALTRARGNVYLIKTENKKTL